MYKAHIIATWLHIISAIYWIGAILFILSVLGPVLRKQPGIVVLPIMSEVHSKVRSFVLAAIIIFLVTGTFNMYYRGLFDTTVLFGSSYGRVFLLKMFPVAIMLVLYFSAPALMEKYGTKKEDDCTDAAACCEMEEGPQPGNKVFAMLHVAALLSGSVAVLLGVMLRG